MQTLLPQATDEEFVTHCYRYFLARDPDAGGKAHHMEALSKGMTREALFQVFAASGESVGRFNVGPTRPQFAPDGHFYSPVPAVEDYEERYEDRALHSVDEDVANGEAQLALAQTFKTYYDELPFPRDAADGYRYHLNNGRFNYFDGITLYCFIRHFRPRRIVEVGSGFSSAAMIDTCEAFLDGRTDITFIEPYPETLYGRLSGKDRERYSILEKKVQDVPLDVFRALEANDILFIDSSHVAKFGSDVNHLIFKVLPVLQDGVVIHFHDIFRNFDYPIEWLKEGRAWNEAYLLRAFLLSNPGYKILFFNDWFAHQHWDFLERQLPLCTVQPEGSPFRNCGVSLWIQKIGRA
jgi:hypothetical protein